MVNNEIPCVIVKVIVEYDYIYNIIDYDYIPSVEITIIRDQVIDYRLRLGCPTPAVHMAKWSRSSEHSIWSRVRLNSSTPQVIRKIDATPPLGRYEPTPTSISTAKRLLDHKTFNVSVVLDEPEKDHPKNHPEKRCYWM